MLERFKSGHKVETAPKEIIVPVEGLENRPFSLPEPGEKNSPVGEHKDDWFVVGEEANDTGSLFLTMSRYKEDGSIETRNNIPAETLDMYQVDVDAERRVRDSREDVAIGLGMTAARAAVRMEIVDMVKAIRHDQFNEKYAGLESFERHQSQEIKTVSDERVSESLDRIKGYRDSKRRENPIKGLQRGSHHAGRS